MSKIKFITDSAADIPAELQKELDIEVMPFIIAINDRECRDNVDFTPVEFYKMLVDAPVIPTHSQLTPFYFGEIYQRILEQGYTDLVYITINAGGSATNGNAKMAADAFFDEHTEAEGKFAIHVIDGGTYTMGYGYATVLAAQAARDGADIDKVLSVISDWLEHEKVLFVPYDLKFVKKSGRVSAAAAFLGDALGLKPLITFDQTDGGKSKILSKVRGDKAVVPSIVDIMKEEMVEGSDYICILGSLDDRNRELIDSATAKIGYPPVISTHLGCVISINCGPNVVALVYRKK